MREYETIRMVTGRVPFSVASLEIWLNFCIAKDWGSKYYEHPFFFGISGKPFSDYHSSQTLLFNFSIISIFWYLNSLHIKVQVL